MTHYALNPENLITDYAKELRKNRLYLLVIDEYQFLAFIIDNLRDTGRDKKHIPFYTFDHLYGNEIRSGEMEGLYIPHYIDFPLEITIDRLYEEGDNETGIRIYNV